MNMKLKNGSSILNLLRTFHSKFIKDFLHQIYRGFSTLNLLKIVYVKFIKGLLHKIY